MPWHSMTQYSLMRAHTNANMHAAFVFLLLTEQAAKDQERAELYLVIPECKITAWMVGLTAMTANCLSGM